MYSQRFWKNDKYYRQGSPLFIYVCGEWVCGPPSDQIAPFALGQELNGSLLVLEHRFYGMSQPFSDGRGGW
jgi:hypothetical protein